MNARDKQMHKFEMAKLLNIKLIRDDPKHFKLMQIHENEEDKAVSLAE